MAFDLNEAAQSAATLFDEFKEKLEKIEDPTKIDPSLLSKVQNVLSQSTQALSAAKSFGSMITINPEIKQHITILINHFLSNTETMNKLKILEEATGTDFIGSFKNLATFMSE